ncbi:DUF6118 family protein [Sphingomonas sanguinis]|uniref:DUF6118 family protein n=1 Tax=Sphingomonas sanguinis TaxID=33051 RepID=A0ABU5LPT9_9SPHN|nr:DUF6118 family protein [Sphingomonas sanguinis]MDZ7281959.1 DUF6118 family protein [Sphingomonas sanguinis]
MTQPTDEITGETTLAFEDLRAEISLLRRAVEGLTAARERMPDYTPTLGSMMAQLKTTQEALQRIERSPAVALTPTELTKEIVKAAASARADDARKLDEARDTIARSIGRIDGIVERCQSVEGQSRQLRRSCAATAMATILLWSILPGAIARSLPASWHVPEWMAARIVGSEHVNTGGDGKLMRNSEAQPNGR